MSLLPYVLFTIGLVFIIKGGDYFVEAATWIAKVTGLPEVLIGATIVSLATTFPELMVSVMASLKNYPSMAMGNAVGSVICNTALILGIYNFIKPSKINTRIFNLKGILMLSYMMIVFFLSLNGLIGRISSLILLLMVVVYVVLNLMVVGYKKSQVPPNHKRKAMIDKKQYTKNILLFTFGIALILAGAKLLLTYGVEIAEYWGVPNSIISLTLIAFGTSLPEFVTAITALVKGHTNLSVGNILGSNILNMSMVIGFSSMVRPLTVPSQIIMMDLPIAILLNALLIIPGILYKKITRLQSFLLLVGYFSYIIVLFLIH